MSHTIHAWLERGEARLGIIDRDSGRIQQLWRLSRIDPGPHQPPVRCRYSSGQQQLARELFLISCCEAIGRSLQQTTDCRQCRQQSACRPAAAHEMHPGPARRA